MERTLRVTQARHAIEDVIFRYAEAVDGGDMEALGNLLSACTIVMQDGGKLTGGAEIAEHYRNIIRFYDETGKPTEYQRGRCSPRTRHITTNLVFEFNTEVNSVNVRSYFTVY